MKKIKSNICNFLKKDKEYLLSFFLSFLFILAIFLTQRVFIEDKSMILSDAYGQYYELFYYLKEIFNGTRSIFYTFDIGGGTGMIATLAYYLISPFNIIVAILPIDQLQLAMHIIIMLKIATAGLTMFILLRDEHKKTNYWTLFAFATCYAFSSFMMGYIFDFIWFDAMYLLPLVILGINKLVDGKKPILYGLTLFLTIMCNYYMGYMVCIFSVIYFIYRLFIIYNSKSDKKKMLILTSRYIVTTICLGLMTFFIMYPTLQTMLELNRSSGSYLTDFTLFDFSMIDKMFFGVSDANILNKYSAFLYCGMINFGLVFLYFLNKHIPKKERLASFILLAFLVLSLFFKPFYYLWHVFSSPSSFASRFSFLIIFFTILLAVRAFENIKYSEKKDYLIPVIAITLIGLYFVINTPSYLNYFSIYGTVCGVIFYLFLLYQGTLAVSERDARIIQVLFVILMIAELFANSYIILNAFDKTSYQEVNDLDNTMQEASGMINDDTFYRTTNVSGASMIDNILNSTNGASLFVSTSSSKMLNVASKFGFNGFGNAYKYTNNATPVMDMAFNIKYIYSSSNNKGYDNIGTYKVSSSNGMYYKIFMQDKYVLRNNNTFGIGTLMTWDDTEIKYDDSFEYQNIFLKTISGIDADVFEPVDLYFENDIYSYRFTSTDVDGYYFYFHTTAQSDSSSTKVYFNGKEVISTGSGQATASDTYYIKNDYPVGETVNIRVELNNTSLSNIPALYSFNEDVFNDAVKVLKEYSMTNVEVKNDGYIKGNVNVRDGKNTLYLSVPYETGWSAYVDGEKTEIHQIYGGLISINLSDGEHTVEFKYETPGLLTGMIISLAALAVYILYTRHSDEVDNIFTKYVIKFSDAITKFLRSVCGVLINLFVFILLSTITDIPSLTLVVISWIVSTAYIYYSNISHPKKETLMTKIKNIFASDKEHKERQKKTVLFISYYLILLVLEYIMMYQMIYVLKVNASYSKIVVTIMVTIIVYLFKRLIIVKD